MKSSISSARQRAFGDRNLAVPQIENPLPGRRPCLVRLVDVGRSRSLGNLHAAKRGVDVRQAVSVGESDGGHSGQRLRARTVVPPGHGDVAAGPDAALVQLVAELLEQEPAVAARRDTQRPLDTPPCQARQPDDSVRNRSRGLYEVPKTNSNLATKLHDLCSTACRRTGRHCGAAGAALDLRDQASSSFLPKLAADERPY